MKITKRQLKQIIKEELAYVLDEQEVRDPARASKYPIGMPEVERVAATGVPTSDPEAALRSASVPLTRTGAVPKPSHERGSSWNPLSTDFWAPEDADVFDIRGQKTTEIRLPDGSTIKIPLKPGETTDSPAYKQRVRRAMEGAPMEENKITNRTLRRLVEREVLNTLKD